jgi:adenine-specific DNA-methyltransferase
MKQGDLTSNQLKNEFGKIQFPLRFDDMEVTADKLTKPCRVYSGWANANKLRAFIEGGCKPIDDDGGQIRFFVSEKGVIYYRKERGDNATHILSVLRNLGTTEKMRSVLESMRISFQYPKPARLVEYIIKMCTNKGDIVLDSFAGSGTTAHAVLALNKEDGGNRKFILVEVEDYADKITAERVRRVIKGVPTATDEQLREGLGGSFTFCELGQPISIDGLLKGTALPDYATLASYVFYTATGATLQKPPKKPAIDFLIGQHNGHRIHLIYKPDKEFLRSNDAMLNSDRAETIAKSTPAGSRALVFAAGKFMSQNELAAQRIEFSQLPYTLHRVFAS